MENPFDSVTVRKKPVPKIKTGDLFDIFPEESYNTIQLKKQIAEKMKNINPDVSDFIVFKTTQMFVNKYFYKLNYNDEQKIDEMINMLPEFEMFKTI